MYLKRRLLKISSIFLYISCGLWFVGAAVSFALSNWLYWLFAIFALIVLYVGFITTSIYEKMESVNLAKKENIKLLVCWILSILSPVSFVLTGIAYFRHQEDELVVIRQNIESDQDKAKKNKPKKERPIYLKQSFLTMCISFVLIFALGFSGMCFETVGYSVDVKDFTLTREMTMSYNQGMINGKQYALDSDDTSYSVTMYRPKSATEENPAPTIFVMPGFTRTKATMSQYCIELARRGAVCFTIDPGGQGDTSEPSTNGANGVEYLVQYIYNNTDDFKFVDRDRFGAMGHSAGGGNVCTLASDMNGSSYETSIIKSLYISGYIKLSAANNYSKLNCNAAMSYAYYDEGAFRYQDDVSSFEVVSLRFINEVGSDETNWNTYDTLSLDYGYGSMDDGTYRIVHRENINHCFEMYDKTSIANIINFFDESLRLDSGIDGFSQIWWGKEISNGLALASAFILIVSACYVLMKTKFFKTMKDANAVAVNEATDIYLFPERDLDASSQDDLPLNEEENPPDDSSVSSGDTQAMTLPQPKEEKKVTKSVAHKIEFWTIMIVCAVIACLDYIPLANFSIEIFPTGNSASVFTYVFPARMINAVLLWGTINGAIGLILFFGATLIENLVECIRAKRNDREAVYDWSKFNLIKIRGKEGKWYHVLANVGKALLLALILVVGFYFLDQVSYWAFHQDFRFFMVSAEPVNLRMFVTAIEYIPLLFIFYIGNSIRVNCSIGQEGWKEWRVILTSSLANCIGLIFILIINYVCFFTTGSPYYGYYGTTEVWLYVNMVFSLVVMMALLPILNRLFYKATGNVWVGAIVCCCIFVMMSISASVSYIPM